MVCGCGRGSEMVKSQLPSFNIFRRSFSGISYNISDKAAPRPNILILL